MKFKVGDHVRLKKLDCDGVVLRIEKTFPRYWVYDFSGQYVTNWYDEDELELIPIVPDNNLLDELWEMMRNMSNDAVDMVVGFDCVSMTDMLNKYTPEEALDKYRAWKEKSKLSVGDVVYMDDALDAFGVVTYFEADDIDSNQIHVLWYDGSTMIYAANDPEIHKHPNGYRMRIDEYVLNDLKEWGWERRD